MTLRNSIQVPLAVITMTLAVYVPVLGCQSSGGNGPLSPEQQKRVEAIRAKGTKASLTIFPVVMVHKAQQDIADVVALLLEQAGMSNLKTSDAAFRFSNEAAFEQAADQFGEFVRENPIDTEYALYAEIVGTPDTGPKEIRGIIVDQTGQAVWVDRQTAADREFKRAKPHSPMTCCQFLAERVRKQLRIPKSARDDSGEGPFARKLRQNSPGPGKAEWAAMKQRQAVMKKARRSAKLVVFPVRLSDNEAGSKEAAHLAELLNSKKMLEAHTVESSLRVKIQPSRNEQKWLWSLAHSFQDHIRRNPPEADYAMLADYMMHPSGNARWAVHFVVCDRSGEWVIVDFQNEHHGDFQSVDPKTLDDCGQVVAKRLDGYLQ